MKNLAQFKKRLTECLANNGTLNIVRHVETAFSEHHPKFTRYPDGVQIEHAEFPNCKLGRVQSNSFTRLLDDGRESWSDFQTAKNWTFPSENTAVFEDGYTSTDHKHTCTLTYTFL